MPTQHSDWTMGRDLGVNATRTTSSGFASALHTDLRQTFKVSVGSYEEAAVSALGSSCE